MEGGEKGRLIFFFFLLFIMINQFENQFENFSLIETEENIRKAKKRKAVLSLSKADRQQIRSLLQNKKVYFFLEK